MAVARLVTGLNYRILAARMAFRKLDKAAGGKGTYVEPDDWNLQGALNAVAGLLIEKGLTTDEDLTVRMATAQIVVLEEALRAAQAHFQEATGQSVALGYSTRPQG